MPERRLSGGGIMPGKIEDFKVSFYGGKTQQIAQDK